MLSHHFFYKYLDSQSIDSSLFAVHGFTLSDQSVSRAYRQHHRIRCAHRPVGGIGVVFVQVLWSKLRREQFSVKQIDSLVACKGQPFTLAALPTWHYAFWLAAIAATASLMSLISIVAPGSLRIQSSDYSFSSSCTVSTIALENSNIGSYAVTRNSSTTAGGLSFAGRPCEAYEAVGPSPHGRCCVESYKSLRWSMPIRHQVQRAYRELLPR